MKISNRDRFPEVSFLPADKFRDVGTVGTETLILVGTEEGTNAPVVARSSVPVAALDSKAELFAIPLYDLLTHSPDAISIPNRITP